MKREGTKDSTKESRWTEDLNGSSYLDYGPTRIISAHVSDTIKVRCSFTQENPNRASESYRYCIKSGCRDRNNTRRTYMSLKLCGLILLIAISVTNCSVYARTVNDSDSRNEPNESGNNASFAEEPEDTEDGSSDSTTNDDSSGNNQDANVDDDNSNNNILPTSARRSTPTAPLNDEYEPTIGAFTPTTRDPYFGVPNVDRQHQPMSERRAHNSGGSPELVNFFDSAFGLTNIGSSPGTTPSGADDPVTGFFQRRQLSDHIMHNPLNSAADPHSMGPIGPIGPIVPPFGQSLFNGPVAPGRLSPMVHHQKASSNNIDGPSPLPFGLGPLTGIAGFHTPFDGPQRGDQSTHSNHAAIPSSSDMGMPAVSGKVWPKIFRFTDGRINLSDFEKQKKIRLNSKNLNNHHLDNQIDSSPVIFDGRPLRRKSFLILHGGYF